MGRPHLPRLRRTGRALRSRLSGDRGSVEFATIFPVALLLVFAAIQAGLFFHARSVAAHAAQAGVDAGRSYDAPAGAGEQAARDFLARTGNSVSGAGVSAARSGSQFSVTVTGRVPTLLPGVTLSVSQQVQAPIEEFK